VRWWRDQAVLVIEHANSKHASAAPSHRDLTEVKKMFALTLDQITHLMLLSRRMENNLTAPNEVIHYLVSLGVPRIQAQTIVLVGRRA
jgi:hypothetical protein